MQRIAAASNLVSVGKHSTRFNALQCNAPVRPAFKMHRNAAAWKALGLGEQLKSLCIAAARDLTSCA